MKELRIFYAAGPGHVIGTFVLWKSGYDDPFEPAVAYSAQLYDVCREFNAHCYVVSACSERGFLHEGAFRLKHHPYSFRNSKGLLYHLGQLWNGLLLMTTAIWFRADVAVIAEGSHWFVFSLLALTGVKVVPTLHWRVCDQGEHIGFVRSIVRRLDSFFFARSCFAVMSMPNELPRQVAELTGGKRREFVEFLPTYTKSTFQGVSPPEFEKRPFVVLYVGRIEVNKGVFDLLDVAERLANIKGLNVQFNVCGDGTALRRLRLAAVDVGVADSFHCHGHCDKSKVREMYGRSHVVVVPTRSEIGEGFNKVIVEAVLTGRPVITSALCPALDYVREAALEVPADDPLAYAKAIALLAEDKDLYGQKCDACVCAQTQFYDLHCSWGAALKRVFAAVRNQHPPAAFTCPTNAPDAGKSLRRTE